MSKPTNQSEKKNTWETVELDFLNVIMEEKFFNKDPLSSSNFCPSAKVHDK